MQHRTVLCKLLGRRKEEGKMSLYHSTENRTWMVSPSLPSVHICEMESGIALEFLQGNRASICVEGGISRSFPICRRKLWVPSSCDGDLRELLMVPMGSQESFRVVRGLSGFLSSRCRGIGPHLELRLEPQGSSPVLTWISGFLWSFNRGVRPRLVWRH